VDDKSDVLGVPLSTQLTIDTLLERCEQHLADASRSSALTVTFVNPHAWTHVKQHADYLELLRTTDVVLADGIGVALAATRITGHRVPRISFDFTSLAGPFLERSAARGWSVGLVGADPGVTGRAAARIQERFPGLPVIDCGDGFRSFDATAAQIHEANVDVVILGMGVPRQERFMHHLARTHRGILITCGGFLDQSQASLRYYPRWVDRLNLRFAYRLAREPRRLGRRYMVEYWPFVTTYVRHAIRGR
jgi:N-acetylglucosaminyldiphosphoundecaprenol N-acetyl-beta-D-mannosaminyltransferase